LDEKLVKANLETATMVKALSFKGDPKPKKRKRVDTAAKFDTTSQSSKTVSNIPADAEVSTEDDSWVSAESAGDLIGPIIFVLPSEPPSCIACDTNGKVFASLIENIVDGDPATAEPHDVRQVWVATRVAGTENFSFKGHHGKCVFLIGN
jgi:protein FRG1